MVSQRINTHPPRKQKGLPIGSPYSEFAAKISRILPSAGHLEAPSFRDIPASLRSASMPPCHRQARFKTPQSQSAQAEPDQRRQASGVVVGGLLFLLLTDHGFANARLRQTKRAATFVKTIFFSQLCDPLCTLQNVTCATTSLTDLERLIERHVTTPLALGEQQRTFVG
jgi:hypothetical protein